MRQSGLSQSLCLVVTNPFGFGIETTLLIDELAALAQEFNQGLGIHIAGTAGMKTRCGTKTLMDRQRQALAGKGPPSSNTKCITS